MNPILARSSAFSRVTALAELRPLHAAFRWLHLNGQQMMRWQMELVSIPAPPFGEARRSAWMAEQFRTAGLSRIQTDAVGNVFAEMPGGEVEGGSVILLSAHLDTVFPEATVLEPVLKDDRLEAPGACDNAAGVTGMLGIAHALMRSFGETQTEMGATLVFVGNVGEEGEGDLRGVRHLYAHSAYAGRVAAHIVLDGAGAETAVTQALGSRRFQATVEGPGGHSFTDAGTPNPIFILGSALHALSRTPLQQHPDAPRTTMNVGTIEGGTSVNTIPESASATLDFRSTDVQELLRMEVALHRAVEDAVDFANLNAAAKFLESKNGDTKGRGGASFSIVKIGDRPAAELARDSALLEALKAVDRHLNLRTDLRLGSTDANLPLSLGVPAVSLGAGGEGGGAHTRGEWYSAANRELGLRRVLLLTLSMLEWAGSGR